LFEACKRAGWELLAYSILSNHFHLCLGTPRGNLSEGMRWLQATFANRFNCYRNESGHLFKGRFKPLVVESGQPLLALVNYIDLNPLRAVSSTEASSISGR
jgi:putative transposase